LIPFLFLIIYPQQSPFPFTKEGVTQQLMMQNKNKSNKAQRTQLEVVPFFDLLIALI
jgi:hypothetical protein